MKEVFLPAKAIVAHGEFIWIYQEQYNYLMHYDVTNKKLQIDIDISKEIGAGTYNKLLVVNGIIYMIPDLADCIISYKIQSGEINKINLPDCMSYTGTKMFCNAILINNKIYCVSCSNKFMVVFDGQTGKLDKLVDVAEMLQCHTIAGCFESVITHGNSIIGIIPNTNKIFVIDTASFTADIVEIGFAENVYTTIASDGTNVFLYEYASGVIYKYSYVDKRVLQKIQPKYKLKYRVCSFGDKILLDPINGGNLIVVDSEGELICELNTIYNISYRMDALCVGAVDESGKFYYNSLDNYLYLFDGKSMSKVDILKMDVSKEVQLNNRLFCSYLLRENRSVSLESFIHSV
ncbi:MAG: hypothetical protein Q4D54_02880 [Eubacteriales bacterium]|nr:hypothetical protein [Eubacteriales bacterium]